MFLPISALDHLFSRFCVCLEMGENHVPFFESEYIYTFCFSYTCSIIDV